ncbi:SCO4848 family membrane protein [Nocardioides aurantiacus]|uniref:SCO4848 family membrane protein n=1 Tax=Nocardioides aurantiacus TaxID=86796 RepID=UPI00403F974F
MKLERKHALVLLAVAVWNVVTYAQFTKALVQTEEDRPTGYFVAHGVLIVVNLLIAVVLGRWGLQALRAQRAGR